MSTQPLPQRAHQGWLWRLRIFTALSTLIFLTGTVEFVREGSPVSVALCLPWLADRSDRSIIVVTADEDLWRSINTPHELGLRALTPPEAIPFVEDK
jgi:hypothetical protein